MKTIKVLKWAGLTLAAAAGLWFAYVYGRSYYIFNKVYDVPLTEIAVPTDSASVAEGLRQVRLLHCTGCHGGRLEGKVMREDAEFGRLVSANVPQAVQGYSDAELYRLIRHGLKKNGKIAFVMPARSQYHLKDQAVAQVIAYLRTLEAQENEPPLPPMAFTFNTKKAFAFGERVPEQLVMDHRAPRLSAQYENNPVAHGNYLTKTLCSHCHGDNLEGSARQRMPAQGPDIVFFTMETNSAGLCGPGKGQPGKRSES